MTTKKAPSIRSGNSNILVLNASSGKRALAGLLESAGFKVRFAKDSSEVRKITTNWRPAITLAFLTRNWVDKQNGWNALKRFNRKPTVPVLAVIGKKDLSLLDDVKKRALYDDFILKPCDEAELMSRITSRINYIDYTTEAIADKHRLESILEITNAVFSSPNLSTTLEIIVDKVAEAIRADDCSIVHLEKRGKDGFVLESFKRLPVKKLPLNLDLYPELKVVLETKYPLVVEDIANHPFMYDIKETVKNLVNVSALIIPIVVNDPKLGTILLRAKRYGYGYSSREIKLCRMVAEASCFAIKNANVHDTLKKERRKLKSLTVKDPLTSLYNHNYFYKRLDEEIGRSERYGTPLSLLMIDIDDFKKVNDTHGHRFGDSVLLKVATILKQSVRASDIAARYGGEEFAVILTSTELKGAKDEAERLRKITEDTSFGKQLKKPLTISIGAAVYNKKTKDSGDLVNAADKALYKAKRAGKNCVKT